MTTEPLPPLYQRWIDALERAPAPLPREGRATCHDCAMCGGSGGFRPDTKCCTYVPALPGFNVGLILADASPEGEAARRAVSERIAQRAGVTPLGIRLTDAQRAVYAVERQRLGRSLHVRCPYHIADGGLCGIWRHRNAVCSTWFCKHERGAAGFALWRAVQALLEAVEEALSFWCLIQLDVGDEALGLLAQPDHRAELSGDPPPAAYRAAWGRWHGRERELYLGCGRLVSALAWPEVLAIGGAPVQAAARALIAARRAYAEAPVAGSVELVPLRTVRSGRDTSTVTTYSPHDALELPTTLLDALRAFDGRPTAEALAEIEEEHGLAITPELVQRLVDFEVLAPTLPGWPERAPSSPR
jgi:hypothetical protein